MSDSVPIGPTLPPLYPGYVLGTPWSNVTIEFYFDLACPDSKAAWPVMQELVKEWGEDNLGVILHLFPLPYHHNGFLAAQSVALAEKIKPGTFTQMVDTLFTNQLTFWDNHSMDKTEKQIIELLCGYAKPLGIDPVSMEQEFKIINNPLNMSVRQLWKFGCQRGVFGTPTFFINGIWDYAADSTWTASQWNDVLKKL